MRFHLGSRRLRLGVAVGAALALGTGVAFGSIPDSGGVIHACYNKTNGKIRVTDAQNPKLTACLASTEVALDWNTQGPAGPAGPEGARGPQGDPGPPGSAGTQVLGDFTAVPPGGPTQRFTVEVACPAGQVAVSGGFFLGNPAAPLTLLDSYRGGGSPSRWIVDYANPGSTPALARAIAYCAPAS